MTKTENRAAAKAYHRERMQKHREEAHALDVADLWSFDGFGIT
jgi:hypothetical protein